MLGVWEPIAGQIVVDFGQTSGGRLLILIALGRISLRASMAAQAFKCTRCVTSKSPLGHERLLEFSIDAQLSERFESLALRSAKGI